MTNKNKTRIIAFVLLISIAALLVSIYVIAYLGSFSRYIADDYCSAGEFKALGYLGSITSRYITWDGRYSFSSMIYFFDSLGIKFPSILPAISITLLFASAYYFFSQVLKAFSGKISRLTVMLITSVFVFLIEYTTPQIAEVFYWMTGIATYQFSIIFELILLGLTVQVLINPIQINRFRQILLSLLLFLLSFVCSGFSEVSTAIHVSAFALAIFFALVYRFIMKKYYSHTWYLLIMFFGALVGFIVMAMAPGNLVRSTSLSPLHPSILDLIAHSLSQSAHYSISWFSKNAGVLWPVIILTTVLGAYNSSSFSPSIAELKSIKIKVILFSVTGLILTFVSFVPTTWAGYDMPAERILLLPTAILGGTLITVSYLLGLLLAKEFEPLNQNSILVVGMFSLFCLFFVFSTPIYMARQYYGSMIPIQSSFAQKWDKVNQAILVDIQEGQKDIFIDNIQYDVVNLERITENPDYWVNYCAARFYQIDKIQSR